MTPTVTVPNFEGPLGLLLELVEHGKLEVTAISVGAVTRQYLERVKSMTELPREDLALFLELGARLTYIKSLALLPAAGNADDDLPASEIRQLNQELAEYRRFQAATQHLRGRLNAGHRSYERSASPRLELHELPRPEIDLMELGKMFQDALKRAEPAPERLRHEHDYDQAAIATELYNRAGRGEVKLTEVVAACRDRIEVIVTFLAVLELVRGGRAAVRQSQLFSEIVLARVEA